MLALIFGISASLIVYTYFGYPLLLALLARLFPHPVHCQETHTPTLTLLIAAYNEQNIISAKLENSLTLDYPADRLQILVATDGSDDRTPDLVRHYATRGVELSHHPERRGKMAAIERAMPSVRGDIVVFSDANAFYRPDALHKLARNFADEQVGVVSGSKTVLKDQKSLTQSEGLYWRYESSIKQKESLLDSTTGVVGEIMALRRALYQPPTQAIINDDFYMAYTVLNQGYRVIYEPEAIAEEKMSESLRDERIRRSRIVAGRYQLLLRPSTIPWRRPWVAFAALSHKALRPLVPFLMIMSYVTNLLWWYTVQGGPIIPAIPLAGQTLFYASAIAGWMLNRLGITNKLLYIPYYLCSANLAALGGFIKFITGGQSTQWKKVR